MYSGQVNGESHRTSVWLLINVMRTYNQLAKPSFRNERTMLFKRLELSWSLPLMERLPGKCSQPSPNPEQASWPTSNRHSDLAEKPRRQILSYFVCSSRTSITPSTCVCSRASCVYANTVVSTLAAVLSRWGRSPSSTSRPPVSD